MKIALVSPYDWAVSGGVNNHIAHLAEQFVELGHEPHIVAPGVRSWHERPCPITMIGRPIPLRVSGSVARITLSLRTAGKVKRVLEEGFDIVHVHEPFMPQLPIQFLRYSTAVNVGTWHAARESNFFYLYGRRLIKRWQTKLDGKIAVSSAAVKHIEQYFPGYYNIIPNGVDVEHFAQDAAPLPEFSDGKKNVLFVGRPEKRKGLKYLIRAFVGVQRAMPDSRLIVVGAGKFDRYERAVRSAKLHDVVFRSYVPFDELPRYHHSAARLLRAEHGVREPGHRAAGGDGGRAADRRVEHRRLRGRADARRRGAARAAGGSAGARGRAHRAAAGSGEVRRRWRRGAGPRGAVFSWDRVSQQVLSYYERLIYERRLIEREQAPGTTS